MEQFNIFDFDGTVADSMGVWEESTPRLLRRLGREPDPGLNRRLVHLSLPDKLHVLRQEYHLPQTEEELLRLVLEQVEDEYRLHIRPKPGVERVLQTLKQAGCRCCIATSNESRLVEIALKRMELDSCFSFILSAEPGHGKDRPDIFLQAMQRLGGCYPSHTAVFEDSPLCMETALRAGFRVYGVQDNIVDPTLFPAGLAASLSCWGDWRPEL